MFPLLFSFGLLSLPLCLGSSCPSRSTPCSSFAHSLGASPNFAITTIISVSKGAFTTPTSGRNTTVSNTDPFCRITGKIPYGFNSTLGFEVWLPAPEAYNGRFLAIGMSEQGLSGRYSSIVFPLPGCFQTLLFLYGIILAVSAKVTKLRQRWHGRVNRLPNHDQPASQRLCSSRRRRWPPRCSK